MNCFSASPGNRARLAVVLIAALFAFPACGAASSDPPTASLVYRVTYTATPDPRSGAVAVRVDIGQPQPLLREMRMTVDPDRFSDFEGDGELHVEGNTVRWQPGDKGGSLKWLAKLDHRRNGDGYDALLGAGWGVFRAEDIIPRASTRTREGALSDTNLEFRLPRKWSVITSYPGEANRFAVVKPQRRFDQPDGWIVVGELGVRRDEIAGTKVVVAAPKEQSVRRLEMLALLRWTLPELARVVPSLPERLTIISAGEPMWRGALSAPTSMFIHAERPLISENATSTLLHEVVHVTANLRVARGYDWIVEGIAEYYSLEMLYRSDGISKQRYAQARERLSAWGRSAQELCAPVSSGPVTARAVSIFAKLDREIRKLSGGAQSLDDVVSELSSRGRVVDLQVLTDVATKAAGGDIETLHTDRLPGCRTLSSGDT